MIVKEPGESNASYESRRRREMKSAQHIHNQAMENRRVNYYDGAEALSAGGAGSLVVGAATLMGIASCVVWQATNWSFWPSLLGGIGALILILGPILGMQLLFDWGGWKAKVLLITVLSVLLCAVCTVQYVLNAIV